VRLGVGWFLISRLLARLAARASPRLLGIASSRLLPRLPASGYHWLAGHLTMPVYPSCMHALVLVRLLPWGTGHLLLGAPTQRVKRHLLESTSLCSSLLELATSCLGTATACLTAPLLNRGRPARCRRCCCCGGTPGPSIGPHAGYRGTHKIRRLQLVRCVGV
jgi:hypothetical protein